MSSPRVLTLEEVNNAPDDAWMYLEFRQERAYSWNAYRLACVIRVMLCTEHRKQYYGIRYRCWDQKPSAEDTKKTEWRN